MENILGILLFAFFVVGGFRVAKLGFQYGLFDGCGELVFGGFFFFIGAIGLLGILTGKI